jgi:hypothetical protein
VQIIGTIQTNVEIVGDENCLLRSGDDSNNDELKNTGLTADDPGQWMKTQIAAN